MASIITIKCNKNVLNIYIIISFYQIHMLYKNAHDRTISIFLNVIISKRKIYLDYNLCLGLFGFDLGFVSSLILFISYVIDYLY